MLTCTRKNIYKVHVSVYTAHTVQVLQGGATCKTVIIYFIGLKIMITDSTEPLYWSVDYIQQNSFDHILVISCILVLYYVHFF